MEPSAEPFHWPSRPTPSPNPGGLRSSSRSHWLSLCAEQKSLQLNCLDCTVSADGSEGERERGREGERERGREGERERGREGEVGRCDTPLVTMSTQP